MSAPNPYSHHPAARLARSLDRPLRYFLINSGYWLVSLLAASAILACWH